MKEYFSLEGRPLAIRQWYAEQSAEMHRHLTAHRVWYGTKAAWLEHVKARRIRAIEKAGSCRGRRTLKTAIAARGQPVLSADEPPRIPSRAIIKACEEHTQVTYREMCSVARNQRLVKARYLAFVALRRLRGASLPKIGETFNRDHSTVLYGLRHWNGSADELEAIGRAARRIAEEN